MSKQIEKALVPELRFPEFRDAGEWEEVTFGGAATFINGRAYTQDELLEQGKYRVLRVGNFFTNKEWYYSDLELDENKYCDDGDLLYAWSASFAPRIWRGEKVIYHYHIWKVIENKEVDKKFLYILLEYETEKMKSQSANGLGLLHITKGTIEGWETHFPSLKEQQKIAECLTSIDELITAHTQKHDALKAHKKGLMQQLFPAKGDDCMDAGGRATQDAKAETVPKLRFPEFDGEEEWVEDKFGDITNFASGGTPSKDKAEYWNGDIPWISAASMHEICIENSDRNITHLAVDDGAKIASKGTLLLLVRGSMLHKRIPIGIAERDVAFNQDVKALNLKKNILKIFLLYLLIANEMRLLGIVTKTGIGAGKLDTNDLKDFLVCVPKSSAEQQKIADCLSSIDSLITAQAQKIKSLKAHKKGLMQQLFPSADEVNI